MLASIATYLITNRSICICHIYFVGVFAVSYELLYLRDSNKSKVTVLVAPNLALYSQPNVLLPRYYLKKSEVSDSPITSTFTFKI